MSEDLDRPEAGGEASPGVDPAAVALALAGAGREEANSFLRNQNALIGDQRRHLREQLKQLQLGILSQRLSITLKALTAVLGMAIATGLGIAIWQASRAEGVIVDAFSVPPQFSETGVTGEVIADDLTGRIAAVRAIAVSNSISRSREVRKGSAEDIKVEIPETGVSLGQGWRDLRLLLGHERHLSGNLRLTGPGKIALTVALNGQRLAEVGGASGDLDKLEQQAAEQIFAGVDPNNYVLYLRGTERDNDALAAVERAAQMAGGPFELADTHALWANILRVATGDMAQANAKARYAAALEPQLIAPHREFMHASLMMGHDEEALRQAQLMRDLKNEDQSEQIQGQGFTEFSAEGAFERDAALGAFMQAASEGPCPRCSPILRLMSRTEFLARAHDGAGYRAAAGEAVDAGPLKRLDSGFLSTDMAKARYFFDADANNWQAAIIDARAYATSLNANKIISAGQNAAIQRTQVAPLLAYALARSGDFHGAQATIDVTPLDCYDCLRTRGLIAAAAKEWSRADDWFARAVKAAPSIPFAYADWGQALLARGQPDAAIGKFEIANQKGPQFADALEGWGEALMAKNQSHLALTKFAEAEKYAPNWGRLHLKWGEALVYASKREEAQKHLVRAAQLDLTSSEKFELARQP